MRQTLVLIGLLLSLRMVCYGLDESPSGSSTVASLSSSFSSLPEPTPVFIDSSTERVLNAIAPLSLPAAVSEQIIHRCCFGNSEVFLVEDGEQLKQRILPYTLNRDEGDDPAARCLILPAHYYEIEAGLWLKRVVEKAPVTLEICGVHDLIAAPVIPVDATSVISSTPESSWTTTPASGVPEPTPFPGGDFFDQRFWPGQFPNPASLSLLRFTDAGSPDNSSATTWEENKRFYHGQTYDGYLQVRLTGLFVDFSLKNTDSVFYIQDFNQLKVWLSYIRSESTAVINFSSLCVFKNSIIETGGSASFGAYRDDGFGSFNTTGCTLSYRGSGPVVSMGKFCINSDSFHLEDSRLIGLSSQIPSAVEIGVALCWHTIAQPDPVIRGVHFYGVGVPVSLYASGCGGSNPDSDCYLSFENSNDNYWYNAAGEFASRGCNINPEHLLRGEIRFQDGIVCNGTEPPVTPEQPVTQEPVTEQPVTTVSTSMTTATTTATTSAAEYTGYKGTWFYLMMLLPVLGVIH